VSVFSVNKNPTTRDLHAFGKAMLLGFGILGALLWVVYYVRTDPGSLVTWTGSGSQVTAVTFWALGAFLLALSFAAPAAAKPVYVIWMTVAAAIGMVMSTILLTVLFFVLTPIFALIVRPSDPLRKKLQAGGTYWEDYKPHEASIERLKRPF